MDEPGGGFGQWVFCPSDRLGDWEDGVVGDGDGGGEDGLVWKGYGDDKDDADRVDYE